MASKLRYNDNEIQELLEDIKTKILTARINSGEFKLSFSLKSTEDKATLQFSSSAWSKMYALVDDYKGEVEWHGIVNRVNRNTFIITDILIFPHEVSSVTVTSDPEVYITWLNGLDDETFNHLRFHGHSHVNMGVTPSHVDSDYRKNILDNFNVSPREDLFYIFLITNKRREIEAEIYDFSNNLLYGANDINIEVILENDNKLSDFLIEAHSVTTEYVTKPFGFGDFNSDQNNKFHRKKSKSRDNYNNWHGDDYWE